jgi:hypothetical protein
MKGLDEPFAARRRMASGRFMWGTNGKDKATRERFDPRLSGLEPQSAKRIRRHGVHPAPAGHVIVLMPPLARSCKTSEIVDAVAASRCRPYDGTHARSPVRSPACSSPALTPASVRRLSRRDRGLVPAQGTRVAVLKPLATGCERRTGGAGERRRGIPRPLRRLATTPLDVVCRSASSSRWPRPWRPSGRNAGDWVPCSGRSTRWRGQRRHRRRGRRRRHGAAGRPAYRCWTSRNGSACRCRRRRAGLGTMNHTLLTARSVRRVTRVAWRGDQPATRENAALLRKPTTGHRQWGRTSVLCVVPDEPTVTPELSPGLSPRWGSGHGTSSLSRVNTPYLFCLHPAVGLLRLLDMSDVATPTDGHPSCGLTRNCPFD